MLGGALADSQHDAYEDVRAALPQRFPTVPDGLLTRRPLARRATTTAKTAATWAAETILAATSEPSDEREGAKEEGAGGLIYRKAVLSHTRSATCTTTAFCRLFHPASRSTAPHEQTLEEELRTTGSRPAFLVAPLSAFSRLDHPIARLDLFTASPRRQMSLASPAKLLLADVEPPLRPLLAAPSPLHLSHLTTHALMAFHDSRPLPDGWIQQFDIQVSLTEPLQRPRSPRPPRGGAGGGWRAATTPSQGLLTGAAFVIAIKEHTGSIPRCACSLLSRYLRLQSFRSSCAN